LEFHGESVEVFFFVFVQLGEDELFVSKCVLDCEEMVESEAGAGVAFAVSCNGGVEDV